MKRMNIFKSISVLIFLSLATTVFAKGTEESSGLVWSTLRGLEYRVKAGFNIGGTSPLPLPEEIRELKSYRMGMQIAIEGDIIKWIPDTKWGALFGVRFENKGMKTDARVKNYHIVMDSYDPVNPGHMEGAWTGYVKTNVKNSYVTLPLQAIYRVSNRWDLKFGPYVSFLTNGDFSGTAYDGYIREGDPTGDKANVSEASYDFSDDLRKTSWGLDAGAEWKAYKHLVVYSDLTWGLNSIFKKDFRSVSFKMYNIYLNFGFGYIF